MSDTSSFVGWARPHPQAAWLALCHGASPDAALKRLLNIIRAGDLCVLRDGHDPNHEPTQPTRRRM